MLNLKDPVIKKFIDDAHKCAERKARNLSENANSEYICENRLFKIMCDDWTREPRRYAEELNRRYGYNLIGDSIIQIFRSNRCSAQQKRNLLFETAGSVATAFVKVLTSRNAADYDKYMAIRKEAIQIDSHSRINERVLCLMLYAKYPELDAANDTKSLEKFGNIYMRHFLYDISDLLKNICMNKGKGSSNGDKKDGKSERIATLENQLNRSDMLLKDLQDEFDARIQESHQDDLIAFFSQLNSEKYGCILDAVFSAKIGVSQLRRNNVQLPPEISGLFILIDKFAQFIRDNEINPILKPGVVQDMSFDEAEACEYEGTPFKTADDVKRVKVISPGWFYKNKDVQISRPRLKEVVSE